MKRISLYIFVLLIFGLASCNIKEDLSDCPGSILLDYTSYSEEILDDIADNEQVSVFIFDASGNCCQIYTHTYGELVAMDYEFKIPNKYNGMLAVVWHGNNAEDYSDNRMVIGQHYKNFHLRLINVLANLHFTRVPPSLWASPLEPIEFCASKSRHRIHMTRIHTEVNINLRQRQEGGGSKELNMADFQTMIVSTNDVYRTDYSLCGECKPVYFTNEDELSQNTYLDWAHVGTLRLTPTDESYLQVAPADSPDYPITINGSKKLDLVDYMLQSRAETLDESSEQISDQRFLDLNKVWNIELLIDSKSYIALSLTINGWTIWFKDIDLN